MAPKSSMLRLIPELIPKALFGRNARGSLKSSQWQREIRGKVVEKAGGHCHVCGASYEKGMLCHEVWRYIEKARVARLEGFRLVCRDCSNVFHFGKAVTLGIQDEAIRHLMKVNNVTKAVALDIVEEAFTVWNRRSSIQDWTIEISKEVVREYPVLAGIKIE